MHIKIKINALKITTQIKIAKQVLPAETFHQNDTQANAFLILSASANKR